jgi:hypothetical protein
MPLESLSCSPLIPHDDREVLLPGFIGRRVRDCRTTWATVKPEEYRVVLVGSANLHPLIDSADRYVIRFVNGRAAFPWRYMWSYMLHERFQEAESHAKDHVMASRRERDESFRRRRYLIVVISNNGCRRYQIQGPLKEENRNLKVSAKRRKIYERYMLVEGLD